MKTEYGIPAPRGVRKDWEATSIGTEGATKWLQSLFVPEAWGEPSKCVGWFDRFDRVRAVVAHYANGRSATTRVDANGKWRTTFGPVPASADTRPKDEDPLAASLASGAVPATPGDAQTSAKAVNND